MPHTRLYESDDENGAQRERENDGVRRRWMTTRQQADERRTTTDGTRAVFGRPRDSDVQCCRANRRGESRDGRSRCTAGVSCCRRSSSTTRRVSRRLVARTRRHAVTTAAGRVSARYTRRLPTADRRHCRRPYARPDAPSDTRWRPRACRCCFWWRVAQR